MLFRSCLVDGGVGGEQQLHAAVVAFAAGDVQRRGVIAGCLVDNGVGGEQQPRARRVTCLTSNQQAFPELDRSFDAVNEAHGLGLVAAPERIDHRVHAEDAIEN